MSMVKLIDVSTSQRLSICEDAGVKCCDLVCAKVKDSYCVANAYRFGSSESATLVS
jgi:hypothetical protein